MSEADLVNFSKNGEMSRNTWICDDDTYHYCPFCDTLENCKERDCEFSTINGAHVKCYFDWRYEKAATDIFEKVKKGIMKKYPSIREVNRR